MSAESKPLKSYNLSDTRGDLTAGETSSLGHLAKMSLNNKDEMRIRIKFKPTVTVTTTDFVKPSLGVFMSEVKLAFVSIHKSLVRNYY